ncbi:deacylase, partial [Sulfurospirillum sp.]|nr:deacylase [Sulfurospirillum sp.]
MLRLFSTIILFTGLVFADGFDFTLIKKGSLKDDNTLFIVGGIQGDEPGGFMAASILSTHYKITKGSVWIVPNFNFYSIIKRNRGPYGDMNRKFADLSVNDHDYHSIEKMKKIILEPNIKMVVNLHDGSGFYREKYVDKAHR